MRPSRLLTLPERRPWRTLAAAAVLLVLAGLSASRLRADPSLAPLIPDGVPAAAAMRVLSEKFEVADRVLVLIEAEEEGAALVAHARRFGEAVETDPKAGPLTRAVVTEPGAAAAAWVREEVVPAAAWYLDEPAYAELERRLTPAGLAGRMDRLAALLGSAAPGSGAAVAGAVADPVGVAELLLATAGRRGGAGGAVRDAFGGGASVSDDGRALLMQLVPAGEPGDLDAATAYTAALRAVIARLAAEPAAPRIRLFGAPPTAAYSAASIRSDMTRSVVGSVVLLQLLFLVAYRRKLAFPLAALPLAAGLLAGFGVYACLRPTLTPLTAAAGAVLAGLGVDFAIHRLGHAGQGRRNARGGSGNAALAGPMAAACGTSLIGFTAMGTSSVPAIRDFALVGALGLAGALLAALTVLPAGLAVTRRAGAAATARDGLARRLAAAVAARSGVAQAVAVLAGVALLVAAAWPTGTARFAHELDALNPRPNPPLEAQADAERFFPAADASLPVLLTAPTPERLLEVDAAVAAAVGRVAPSLADAAGGTVATRVIGLSSLLPPPDRGGARAVRLAERDPAAVAAAVRAAAADAGFEPDALADAAAGLGRLFEAEPPDAARLGQRPLLAASVLPAGGGGHALATVTWTLPPGAAADARGRVVDALGDAVDAVPGGTATGLERGGRVIGRRLPAELAWMLGLAAAGVLAWLLACFRSAAAVGLVLVPPAAGVLAVLAAGNLAGVPLNLLSVLALPLLVGIGVDDGVFLVNHRRRGGATGGDGIGGSVHAITVTSVSTAAGFGSLLLTSTPAIRALGGTLAVGVAACWLASVGFVLPRVARGARP